MTNHLQRQFYVVAVTRGRRTKFGYGERLKDAMAAAGVKDGEGFEYACYARGSKQWAEKNGDVIATYRRAAA